LSETTVQDNVEEHTETGENWRQNFGNRVANQVWRKYYQNQEMERGPRTEVLEQIYEMGTEMHRKWAKQSR